MRRTVALSVVIGAVGCSGAAAPDPPPRPSASAPVQTVVEADPRVGEIGHFSVEVQRAFHAVGQFAPVPEPGPDDWLAIHREQGQTQPQYVASQPNIPGGVRRRIYIQPIGDLEAQGGPPLTALEAYGERFFGLDVEVRDPIPMSAVRATSRMNDGVRQLFTDDILDRLHDRLSLDAYCVVGLTMVDLYPDPEWNFVFGEARLHDRVGVFSFARYDPRFYDPQAPPDDALILQRGLKVMTHEVGHMFGIHHCTHYRCTMNGSNHLEELDGAPMHLCPVCLRKLHSAVFFDPAKRYRELGTLYVQHGFDDEAQFARRRLDYIASGS